MSTMTAGLRQRRRRPGGYTTIEVLIAMTVFSIGAAGIMGMQRATVQGNTDARRMDVANGIAREWMERLRRDGIFWTNTTSFANTTFLKAALAASDWTIPIGCPTTAPGDGLCAAFDVLGRDLETTAAPGAAFCAQVRVITLVPDSLLRAEVRVYWPRQLGATTSFGASGFCSATNAAAPSAANANQIFHFVYAASAIRINTP